MKNLNIEKINEDTFYLEDKGNRMTLCRRENGWDTFWEFFIERKGGSGNIIKFESLKPLEKMYPQWKGIRDII